MRCSVSQLPSPPIRGENIKVDGSGGGGGGNMVESIGR